MRVLFFIILLQPIQVLAQETAAKFAQEPQPAPESDLSDDILLDDESVPDPKEWAPHPRAPDTLTFSIAPYTVHFAYTPKFIWNGLFSISHGQIYKAEDFVRFTGLQINFDLYNEKTIFSTFSVGPSTVDDGSPLITGSFQFLLNTKLGLKDSFGREKIAINWFHISNANTKHPNVGIDKVMFTYTFNLDWW